MLLTGLGNYTAGHNLNALLTLEFCISGRRYTDVWSESLYSSEHWTVKTAVEAFPKRLYTYRHHTRKTYWLRPTAATASDNPAVNYCRDTVLLQDTRENKKRTPYQNRHFSNERETLNKDAPKKLFPLWYGFFSFHAGFQLGFAPTAVIEDVEMFYTLLSVARDYIKIRKAFSQAPVSIPWSPRRHASFLTIRHSIDIL